MQPVRAKCARICSLFSASTFHVAEMAKNWVSMFQEELRIDFYKPLVEKSLEGKNTVNTNQKILTSGLKFFNSNFSGAN